MNKYQAGFLKNGIFISCIESRSLNPISDIADEMNYELRERLGDVKIGRVTVKKNRYKILRNTTTQISLRGE